METLKYLISYILHINVHLAQIINVYGIWTYLILFVIVFCETGLVITPFLPGDSLLFAAGSLFASTTLNVHYMIIALILAAFCGDNTNYHFGKWLGPKVFKQNAKFLRTDYLNKTEAFYTKHGAKAVIIARFIPIIRTYIPFVAGVGKMPYKKFIGFSFIGACLWVGGVSYLGYFFGNIPIVKQNFSIVILVIIVLSILPMIIEFIRAKMRYNKDKPAN